MLFRSYSPLVDLLGGDFHLEIKVYGLGLSGIYTRLSHADPILNFKLQSVGPHPGIGCQLPLGIGEGDGFLVTGYAFTVGFRNICRIPNSRI